jgi:HEAT repeat protein
MWQRLCALSAMAIVSSFVSAGRAEEKQLMGLTQAEVDKAVKDYAEMGWAPVHIKGYAKGTESQFDITWDSNESGARWHLHSDMSAAAFERRKALLAKEGGSIKVECDWQVDGAKRFAAIWSFGGADANAATSPTRTQTKKAPIVTYEKLLDYLNAEIKEEKLLRMLADSPTLFALSPEQEIELKNAGASDRVIEALKSKPAATLNPGDVGSFVVILDCSGSMMEKGSDGVTKFTAARKAVMDLVKAIPNERELAFIVYGHNAEQECEAVEVVLPLSKVSPRIKESLISSIERLNAVGHTPIALSLQKAGKELAKATGKSRVILITDGIETCHGDPEKEAAALIENKNLAGVDVIGLNLNKEEQKAVAAIAAKGRGKFYDAQSSNDLKAAIAKVDKAVVQSKAEPKDEKLPPRAQLYIDQLTDENLGVRMGAVNAIKRLKSDPANKALEKNLIKILNSKNRHLTRWALTSLADLYNDGMLPPRMQIFLDRVGDKDLGIRIDSVNAIKRLNSDQANMALEKILIGLTKSKDAYMKGWALEMLSELDKKE